MDLERRRPRRRGGQGHVRGPWPAGYGLDHPRGDGRHSRQPVGVDLVRGIGRAVVVGMPAGVEEEHRHPRVVEGRVIGAAARRVAVGETNTQLPARIVHHGLEPAAGRHAPDAERPIPEAPDHVEVDHGHGALDGDGGVSDVVTGAEEPDLLAREQGEHQRPRRPAGRREAGPAPAPRRCRRHCRPPPGTRHRPNVRDGRSAPPPPRPPRPAPGRVRGRRRPRSSFEARPPGDRRAAPPRGRWWPATGARATPPRAARARRASARSAPARHRWWPGPARPRPD